MHTDKTTMRWSLAFALALATTGATAAEHQSPSMKDKGGGEDVFSEREVQIETAFSRFDLNDSDDITRDELDPQSEMYRKWNEADQNLDDRIDRAEFVAFQAYNPQEVPATEPAKHTDER